MFTYLALLISFVYTVFYTIYCILVYATLSLLIHIFIFIPFHIPLGICCGIVRYYLLDIAALSELEAQTFRYTCNNIY